MATVTRADLAAAVREEAGLRKRDAAELVDTLIEAICERLAAGEPVGISGFGSFSVRDKSERTGRNPRTGEEAPIAARRAVTFRASAKLGKRVASGMASAMDPVSLPYTLPHTNLGAYIPDGTPPLAML